MGLTHRVDSKAKVLSDPRFRILRGIQSGLTITQISKFRKVSRASVYKVINGMLNEGLLEKTDLSYGLTHLGIQGLHSFVGLRHNLRQHNFHIKFKVLEHPRNWDKKRNEFRKLPYFNSVIKLKNNEQELFNYGNLTIKTTTKSIIVKIPTIYAKNIEDATIQTFGILETTYPKIEKLFGIKLIKNYKACAEVICQEYAKLDDELAKIYNKRGDQLLITGEDGKIWMITDKSFKGDEREYIHTEKAPEDEDAISKSMNILRDEPTIMKDNQREIGQAIGLIKKNADNAEFHMENMRSHVGATRDLSGATKLLKREIKRAFNTQNKLFERIAEALESK